MIGQTVSHYKVLAKLGGGGMGVVYEAEDTRLNRLVALKFLPPQWSHDENAKLRFIREAQAASAIDHPNICNIHSIEETDDGQLFIAMSHYEGQTLKKRIESGPLTVDEALDVTMQVAEGLARAHARGIVHRDIKPANLMITHDGIVKIVDFGLAKFAGTLRLTQEGSTVGTIAYMSPEQTRGEDADSRADVWSLGVVLYEMLSGQLPFKSPYTDATIYAIRSEEPAPLSTTAGDIPESVERVVFKALSKDPAHRYQGAAEMVADLKALKGGGRTESSPTVTAAPISDLPTQIRPGAWWRRTSIRVAAALALALVSAGLYLYSLRKPSAPAERIPVAVVPVHTVTAVEEAAPWPILVVSSFEDTGDDPPLDYFSQGAADTFVRRLAGLRGVYVVPGGGAVDSPLLLHESVRRAGESVQMRFDLRRHDLLNREPDRSLGGNVVEGNLEAIFALQDEAGKQIAALLSAELGTPIDFVPRSRPTGDSLAFDLYLQGRYAMRRSEDAEAIDRAIDLFLQCLSQDPDFALARSWIGEAYLNKEELTEEREWLLKAQNACETAARVEPDLGLAHLCLGTTYSRLGRDKEAAEKFLQAIELDVSLDEAHRGLLALYPDYSKSEEGEEAFRRAALLHPSHWLARAYLGGFHFRQARYDEAASDFEQAVRLSPGFAKAYGSLGAIYSHEGRLGEAIDVLEKALEIQPSLPRAAENLSSIYFLMRRYDRAIQGYETVIETADAGYRSYGNLAKAYYWSGNRVKARELYERAIELGKAQLDLDSTDADAHIMLANYCAMIDYVEEAHRHLEDALSLGDHPELLFQAALVYNHLKDPNRALGFLERAAERGYSRAEVRLTPEFENLWTDPRFKALLRVR